MVTEPRILILTWLIGFGCGLLACIPMGPVNLAIINEGGPRGWRWAFQIGMGAALMEIIYCAIGFAGFSHLFDTPWMRASLQLVSFVLLVVLGLRYLMLRSVREFHRTERAVEEKLHPHSSFLIGFLRVLLNPGVLFFWITASAALVSHGWIEDDDLAKAICVGGVAMGIFSWFGLASWLATRAHHRLSVQGLIRLSHVSGLLLLTIAVVIGVRLMLLLLKQ